MSLRQVAGAWAEGFRRLDHEAGNFQTAVQTTSARVRCYGIAFHYPAAISAAAKSRTFVGTYEIELVPRAAEWLIAKLTLNLKFIDGNREVEKAEAGE